MWWSARAYLCSHARNWPTATLKHERFLLLNTKSVLKGSLNSPSWPENGPGVKCRISCQTGELEILENSPFAGV